MSRFVRVLRERWSVILLGTALFAAVGACFDLHAAREHTAEARIAGSGSVNPALLAGGQKAGKAPPPISAAEATHLLTGRRQDRDYDRRFGPGVERFDGGVSIANSKGTIIVTAHGSNADLTKRAANAVAGTLVAASNRSQARKLDSFRRKYQHGLGRIDRSLLGARGQPLETGDVPIAQLSFALLRFATPPMRVIEPADRSRASFKPGQRVVPMAVLGLSLMLVAVFLLDSVSLRPGDPRRLAAAAGLPLLGRVPRRPSRQWPAYQHAEAGLHWLGNAGPPRVALVTGPPSAFGPESPALRLAEAANARGLRACVMEGDQLEAATLDRLLDRARADYDVVLLDGPRVLADSTVLRLSGVADAVVLCARAGRTTVEELARTREALHDVAAEKPIALLVTGVSSGYMPEGAARLRPVPEPEPA